MKLYNNDEYREEFMALVYSLLSSDGTNDRANQIIAAFDMAPAVEAKPLTPNNPLTLDELRDMDGAPVYCRSLLTGKEGWAICKVAECGGEWYLAFSGGEQAYGDKDTIGKNWLAYRRKPEEETK